ncbi:MAG TPA: hypothetical protein VLD37_04265 [Candidatus Bilamarchaeum sp.]|nr:hypothetical protein [Candidatus Bilamarchaeum sp.]
MELLSIQSFLGASGANWMNNWLPLSLLAVMTAVIIHVIMLMFAKAFSIRELENFAVSELMQAAATAFMAIFLVTMVTSAVGIANNIIGGQSIACGAGSVNIATGDSVMDSAYSAIRCRLQTRAQEIAEIQGDLLENSAGDFAALNLAISLFGIPVFKGDWVGDLYKKTETTRITNNLATVLLIGLNAQSALIEYLRLNMLHIFIPVGILLRSFYFTRGPGALFIAMGIGMYFMFPIFYVMLDPGFTPRPPSPPAAPAAPTPFCYATMTNAVSTITTLESSGLGSTSGIGQASLRSELSKSYVTLLLHPLVAFFMTMVFVRYMMTVLGGDTYELSKMVTKVI